MNTILLILDENKQESIFNEDHIVAIEYNRGHDTLSIASKLVIVTTHGNFEYLGELADGLYSQLPKSR